MVEWNKLIGDGVLGIILYFKWDIGKRVFFNGLYYSLLMREIFG